MSVHHFFSGNGLNRCRIFQTIRRYLQKIAWAFCVGFWNYFVSKNEKAAERFLRLCRDSYQMTHGSYERSHSVDWTQRKKFCKSVTWWRARAKQIFFSNRSIAPPREWIYLSFLPNINDVIYDSYMTSFYMTHTL